MGKYLRNGHTVWMFLYSVFPFWVNGSYFCSRFLLSTRQILGQSWIRSERFTTKSPAYKLETVKIEALPWPIYSRCCKSKFIPWIPIRYRRNVDYVAVVAILFVAFHADYVDSLDCTSFAVVDTGTYAVGPAYGPVANRRLNRNH